MNTRREFVKNSAGLLMASLLPWNTLAHQLGIVDKVGIQLFSLPKMLEKDFAGTIEFLAKMGYKEVELFGPFPFSAQVAQDRWKSITPMLGFSGSGYFGKSPKEIKSILKANGITTPSAHTDLDTLVNNMDKLGEAANVLGHKYVVLPSIPDDKRQTLDDYKRISETFNKIGENAKRVGLKFGYHNHGYGLSPLEGQIPLYLIMEQTDPNLVFFEMDIYWTSAGGIEPISLLEKYPNRYHLLHLKDMKEKKHFSGDGNTAPQWFELFPYMTSAGDGVLGVKEIVEKAKSTGVKHFFVEQDLVADPDVALKRSIDFLKKV
ncbi:sugar phosphate isomerase/epimerase family protein [Flectobacillus major]|uniref:sugar phosphate isomerase/epimerase family protein n=1 Tax=Flectobacillus major TaxID=103 RepID=UPI0005C5905B|nr:sugar phosphate isomerase/epimerase [Flectobacillus major]